MIAEGRAARVAALARPLTVLEAAAVRDRWDTARARAGRPAGLIRWGVPLTKAEVEEFTARWQATTGTPARLVPDDWNRDFFMVAPWRPGEVAVMAGPGQTPAACPWWRRVWGRISR